MRMAVAPGAYTPPAIMLLLRSSRMLKQQRLTLLTCGTRLPWRMDLRPGLQPASNTSVKYVINGEIAPCHNRRRDRFASGSPITPPRSRKVHHHRAGLRRALVPDQDHQGGGSNTASRGSLTLPGRLSVGLLLAPRAQHDCDSSPTTPRHLPAGYRRRPATLRPRR
jgi:hypothetical protein